MDRNLHTDDFERLLREKSDEFRMYPSKRIWYSVYNNIHPGRKWPSVVMSIVLITSLLWIGYLNTSEPNRIASTTKASRSSSPELSGSSSINDYLFLPFTTYNPSAALTHSQQSFFKDKFEQQPVKQLGDQSLSLAGVQSPGIPQAANSTSLIKVVKKPSIDMVQSDRLIPASTLDGSLVMLKVDPIDFTTSALTADLMAEANSPMDEHRGRLFSAKMAVSSGSGEDHNPESLAAATSAATTTKAGSQKVSLVKLTDEEKNWIENYAMYNRPLPKKWAGKLAWQMYATPSVVFRQLTNDPNFGATANSAPFVIPVNNQDINSQVTQKPSFGLEAGLGIQYPIFKGLRLKTGLQFNFTRYNSHAYHNTHPVATKLTMHDYTTNSTYELFRTTPYSNKTGLSSVKLHNQTYQVSIPVGLDFKVVGNENLQWNVGVTIQPTYVIGGTSYLISSDRRNYVKESSMLSRWNMNAGFETFLSYKSNGLTYQVGPQFRTQLFSSNIKEFAVEEKLLSYGIKFGIMKTLK